MPATLPVSAGDSHHNPGGVAARGQTTTGLNGEPLVWTGSEWAAQSSLSEVLPAPSRLTASGQAGAVAAGYFRSFEVVAAVGFPQTVRVYDGTSAAGTLRKTFTVNALGHYYYDGDGVTPGNGVGGRLGVTTGCFVEFVGGTSRTVDVMVEVA